MAKEVEGSSNIPTCDDYFDTIQSRKKLPSSLQESLTAAFAQISVSSFPAVPCGKVIEISSDASIVDAVQILSKNSILAAPVRNAEAGRSNDWKERYLGIIDYSAIILWVLENAELAAFALSAGSATAAALGTGAVGGLGAIAVGATGPIAIAGTTLAAAAAALAGGIATEKSIARDAATAVNHLGEQFYRLLVQEEPFKSTTVISIRSDELILEAFKRMKDNRIGGLPVIDSPNRKIVGSLSIQDIRFLLLRPELFSSFRQLTVMDFIEAIDSSGPPLTCGSNACLGSVIDSLSSRRVHRVYVVDGDDVVGVVTLRDVITCFISETPGYLEEYFMSAVEKLAAC